MNHEVTHRSFGRPDDRDVAPVVQEAPAVEAETQEVEETLATNAPEGVDEAPALPVDETATDEAPALPVDETATDEAPAVDVPTGE